MMTSMEMAERCDWLMMTADGGEVDGAVWRSFFSLTECETTAQSQAWL